MIPNLIVPVLNRYDLLEKMVRSIDYPVRNLLIVDNGKQLQQMGGNLTYANEYVGEFNVLSLPSNLGVAASWNLGIKLFPHDDRWFFASNDMRFDPGDLEALSKARRDAVTLSNYYPYFHTFALGEAVVDEVGLFDERFYPAYFEDTDYMRRCEIKNIPVDRVNVARHHENSSTINSDPKLLLQNGVTFQRNQNLHSRKLAAVDDTWSWSLRDRRAGEWLQVD
jgi:GT2 family glycosyltransferase